jgi:hypothetical protein
MRDFDGLVCDPDEKRRQLLRSELHRVQFIMRACEMGHASSLVITSGGHLRVRLVSDISAPAIVICCCGECKVADHKVPLTEVRDKTGKGRDNVEWLGNAPHQKKKFNLDYVFRMITEGLAARPLAGEVQVTTVNPTPRVYSARATLYRLVKLLRRHGKRRSWPVASMTRRSLQQQEINITAALRAERKKARRVRKFSVPCSCH